MKAQYVAPVVIVIVLAAVIFLGGNASLTGFAVGDPITTGEQTVTGSGGSPSGGTSSCGGTCWLVSEGSLPGTFESASGKIGVLGPDNRCHSAQEFARELYCCSSLDCPSDTPVCHGLSLDSVPHCVSG